MQFNILIKLPISHFVYLTYDLTFYIPGTSVFQVMVTQTIGLIISISLILFIYNFIMNVTNTGYVNYIEAQYCANIV